MIKTGSHLWDTEKFWLAVLQGSSRQQWVGFSGADEQVIPGLLEQSEALIHSVKTIDEATLGEQCYLDVPWVKGQMPK